jgi:hypothetical protein
VDGDDTFTKADAFADFPIHPPAIGCVLAHVNQRHGRLPDALADATPDVFSILRVKGDSDRSVDELQIGSLVLRLSAEKVHIGQVLVREAKENVAPRGTVGLTKCVARGRFERAESLVRKSPPTAAATHKLDPLAVM